MNPPMDPKVLVDVQDLHVKFKTWRGIVHALRGVNLRIYEGEILGLIGESGSGKSVTGRSIMDLLEGRPGVVGGSVFFDDRDVFKMSRKQLDKIQGREISMVSQDPSSSLNPVFTVGTQLGDGLRNFLRRARRDRANGGEHAAKSRRAEQGWVKDRSTEMLRRVGFVEPDRHLREYPHQLSGGMCQRVLLAMALLSKPKLLIADEPTTALDVTIQAQILRLIKNLSRDTGTTVLYITHDLSVVAQLCDRVAVMYAGKIVETAPVEQLFRTPVHPYTKALLSLVAEENADNVIEIPGAPPDMIRVPSGCAFHPRCFLAREECQQIVPHLSPVDSVHDVACPPGLEKLRKAVDLERRA